ncbi:MAG: hypothetical protein DMG21_17120 [Acidobacteria bacterium]|nr:MAG: hypothetical protein DMG21_17120 [Acidobacteriota bacterium]
MGRLLCGVILSFIIPGRARSGSAAGFSTGFDQERATESSHASAELDQRTRELEQMIASISTPDVDALARALGVPLVVEKSGNHDDESPLSQSSQLRIFEGTQSGESPACVLFRSGQGAGEGGQPAAGDWTLDYLAWDGTRWRASGLDPAPPGLVSPADWKSRVLPLSAKIISREAGEQMLALLLYDAPAGAVYPLVYRVKEHQATLAWDSRSEESRYEAWSGGQIKFAKPEAGILPAMIASGIADPGLLVFERASNRGFQVRTTYVWKGNEYAPVHTEYEANEDFRLYEFISALHLHNFQAAYALIDPANFLGTDQPSLEAFRDAIQKSWSEFLDDQLFRASARDPADGNGHAFELDEAGKKSKYLPRFSSGPKFLLTSLARREE